MLIRHLGGALEVFGRSWPRDGARIMDGVAGYIESPSLYPGLSGRRNLQLLAQPARPDLAARPAVRQAIEWRSFLNACPHTTTRLTRTANGHVT